MRPRVVVSAGQDLFESFFPPAHQARLNRLFKWERDSARTATTAFKRKLAAADALITTWDSPLFREDILQSAPKLRIIAHCGGEVKSRFAAPLFDKLTITNAAGPMARATPELGAACVL